MPFYRGTSLGRRAPLPDIEDKVSAAVNGYSVRKLRDDYTGPCMNVLRSSDSTNQDIGFDSNGNLDQVALLLFVGVGNGSVAVWYDQSGNGYNLSQGTGANQPNIATSGVINVLLGKPVLRFTTSSQRMGQQNANGKSVSNAISGFSAFWVGKTTNTGVGQILWQASTNAANNVNRMVIEKASSNKYEIGGKRTDADTDAFAVESSTDAATYNYYSFLWDFKNTAVNAYRAGVSIASSSSFQTTGTTDATNSNAITLGAMGSGVNHATLDISEFLGYKRTVSSAEQTTIESDIKLYYGL